MVKTKYKGFWIEEITFRCSDVYLVYPVGAKKPDVTIADKVNSIEDAKTMIDNGHF